MEIKTNKGFSLIEILVALVVVSLTAVNVTALQKKVSDQQRDNIAHSSVISMATEKMEKVLAMTSIEDLVAKDSTSETDVVGHTNFNVAWSVDTVASDLNAGDSFKEVGMDISWLDARGNTQNFTHSVHVNLALLLSGASGDEISDQLAGIIASELNTNEVIYFEPKMGYKKGAFVIHDSYLYEATSVHSVGNGHPAYSDRSKLRY